MIHDNYVQGAYPAKPGADKYTGGGIITDGPLTDNPALAAAFIDIYQNQVVSTANYGVAISSGHDNSIYNNRVVSSGYVCNGVSMTSSYANGANNWNYLNQPATVFFNNAVYNNYIGLVKKNSSGVITRSDWYLPGQTANYVNTNWVPNDSQHPTQADEANEYQSWLKKLIAKKQKVGVSKQPS